MSSTARGSPAGGRSAPTSSGTWSGTAFSRCSRTSSTTRRSPTWRPATRRSAPRSCARSISTRTTSRSSPRSRRRSASGTCACTSCRSRITAAPTQRGRRSRGGTASRRSASCSACASSADRRGGARRVDDRRRGRRPAARRARGLPWGEADRRPAPACGRRPAASRPAAVRRVRREALGAQALRGRRPARRARAVHHARRGRPRIRGVLFPARDPGAARAGRLPLPLRVGVAGLLGANALMFCTGLGLLPWLGVARSWRELASRSGLAYLCGLVATGVLAAHLALVHVAFGWVALALVASVSVVSGAWHLRGSERPRRTRPVWPAVAGAAALAALLVEYARAFAVAPLNRYDAWAIWALKGHALYAFGWADPAVFAGSEYRFANLDYPLLLPSVEAVDFRAMGAFDTRLLHLQFLLFLLAALAALGTVLSGRVHAVVLWTLLGAVALAPAVFDQ